MRPSLRGKFRGRRSWIDDEDENRLRGRGEDGDRDFPCLELWVTTRRMLEGILAMEEEHADDLVTLLQEVGASKASSA